MKLYSIGQWDQALIFTSIEVLRHGKVPERTHAERKGRLPCGWQ
jgi:hypothetical protein